MICDMGRMVELIHADVPLRVRTLTVDYARLEYHALRDVWCMKVVDMGGVSSAVVGHRGTDAEEQAAT